MTDIEIGIMVKNMAREMVSEMSASVKNANKEIRNGIYAIQIISNMMFYGRYNKDEFQVLESKPFSEIAFKNWKKKYGFA